MSRLPSYFADYQARVEPELLRLLPATSDRVQQAMAYTLHAPSKRIRPVLTLLAAELCGGPIDRAVGAAAAIEMVHASSLILDDLPSMDNAHVRRGQPSCHVVFGEGIAILAACGLLAAAFGAIARESEPGIAARLTALVSEAVGTEGLIGGQAADLLAGEQEVSAGTLERIHRGKTGALFSAAATAGAVLAGGDPVTIASLQSYASNLGLAFQVVDDLLDGDEARKTTFVSLGGAEGAREMADELAEAAGRALTAFGDRAGRLRELSAFVATRTA
jgi:geranylgeranyl diphosphate synthase type II